MADARPTAARPTARPLFDPGAIVATPGALQLLAQAGIEPLALLRRHLAGDWGDLDAEDRREISYALRHGLRLLSSYRVTPTEKDWVITEADRSATTFLLPEEY